MASVADTESRPIVYMEIQGLGPNTNATATNQPYRFSTQDGSSLITGAPATGFWLPYLVDVPRQLSTAVDVVTGRTEIGSLSIDLTEGSNLTAPTLTDLFATRNRDAVGDLAANCVAGAATIDVSRVVGGAPAQWSVIAIGAERMLVTNVAAGGGAGGSDRLTVTKGYYGTTDAAHQVALDYGDSEVRYRAHYLRGRTATLYLNFPGNNDSAAKVLGRFVLHRLECIDGTIWRLTFQGIEALLERELGKHAFQGKAENVFSDRLHPGAREEFAEQPLPLHIVAGGDANGGLPDTETFDALDPDSSLGGAIRYGDAVVEYQRDTLAPSGVGVQPVIIRRWNAVRTDLPESNDDWLPVREVLLTDAGATYPRFKPQPTGGGAGVETDHPIAVFLCLALSTGNGSNFDPNRPIYDCLPMAYGAAIPVALFNTDVWEEAIVRTPGARVPNLAIGYDGPVTLKQLAEDELLGPLGIGISQDENGLLRPIFLDEVFPGEGTVLSSDDIIARSEVFDWSMADQITSVRWKFGHRNMKDAPEVWSDVNPEGRDRYPNREDALEIEARGMTSEAGAIDTIANRAGFIRRHFTEPPPRLTLKLNWHHLFLPLGEPVTLTYAAIPNIRTGVRGVTTEPFIVVRRTMHLRELISRGKGGGIEVELFWVGLDSPNTAYLAPALTVAAGDAGVGVVVTVNRNDFSPGNAETIGPIYADDTDSFTAGIAGTGETVILIDTDGVARCANTPRITAKTATTVTLSDVFRDAVAVEVARNPGDVIIYSGDTGAAVYPISAWITTMQTYAGLSDVANETIGTTTRSNQYG